MRLLFLLLIILAVSVKSNAQYTDTVHIYYRTGAYQLDKSSKQALDSFIRNSKPERVLIYSYTDATGSEKNNLDLSVKRAKGVRKYLTKQFPESLIPVCEGMGVCHSGVSIKDDAQKRRTDIFVRGIKKEAINPAMPIKPGSLSNEKIQELEVNQSLRLDNIIFFPGSPKTLPESEDELRRLLDIMKDNPDLEIRLEGHVCCSIAPDGYEKGTDSWVLSQKRAQTVHKYLIDNGISNKRVTSIGFGRTKPLFKTEHTPEEQSANRRVEVRIIHK